MQQLSASDLERRAGGRRLERLAPGDTDRESVEPVRVAAHSPRLRLLLKYAVTCLASEIA